MADLRAWWSEKYKLPPNHDLFVDQTVAELNLEMFEGMLLERNEILESLDSETVGVKMAQIYEKRLSVLNKALGYPDVGQDDVIDKWEAEVAAGRIPNLDER